MFGPENFRNFVNGVSQVSWENVYASHCPNAAYEIFLLKFSELFNNNLPYKYLRLTNKSGKCHYLTPGLIKTIKEKNRLARLTNKWPLTYKK